MGPIKNVDANMQENALFSGEITLLAKKFTLPPIVLVVTYLTSDSDSFQPEISFNLEPGLVWHRARNPCNNFDEVIKQCMLTKSN